MTAPVQTVVNNSNPAEYFAAVTPSDTANLISPCRALYIAGAGNLAVKDANGAVTVFTGVQAGTILPIRTSTVMQTGTTATSIVALW